MTLVSRSRPALYAVGGPLVLGAVLGLPHGVSALARHAATLPAILYGVTILMVPALYVGLALCGHAPPARDVWTGAVRALAAAGVVFLGLAPPVAFLLATSETNLGAQALAYLAVIAGALAAVRALFIALFEERAPGALAALLYLGWAGVGLVIGARLLAGTF